MNEIPPAASDADPQIPWGSLAPGQEVTVRESGSLSEHGVIDNLTPDGSVVWILIDGHAPRRMYLAGDAVEIARKQA